ncbi:ribosomal RNA small subunit methyltransferase A [Candidatus Kaiserbacteria bacterium]|nr:ribosomal RNA small subunit methyltransferase A [Candidatus Kaiserbacteria bacterium]
MKKKRLRRSYGARLGQHFLTGQWAAKRLVDSLHVNTQETILEIGPGKGALTKELLKTGAHVIAIEKDGQLVEQLRETFKNEVMAGKLELLEKDIRNFDPSSHNALRSTNYVLAANIPYYITGEIIRKFLTAAPQPRALALLVQKEVAERIIAGSGRESILSISVKSYGTPKSIAKVSRGNFSPSPSVDSAILLITNVTRDFFTDIDEPSFFTVVRAGFSSKRKLLAGNLKKISSAAAVTHALQACAVPENTRAENLPLNAWKCLAQSLLRAGRGF